MPPKADAADGVPKVRTPPPAPTPRPPRPPPWPPPGSSRRPAPESLPGRPARRSAPPPPRHAARAWCMHTGNWAGRAGGWAAGV